MRSTPRLGAVVAAIAISGWVSTTSAAQPQSFTVDCSKGQTIAAALDRGDERKPLVLTVQGTCNESVTISRDDVTLQGDPKLGGAVNGPAANASTINIIANRVTIDRLTVTGGGHGVSVHGAFNAVIRNSVIQNNGQNGIFVLVGHARIDGSTIQYAGSHGVSLQGGNVLLSNNLIQYNAVAGVHLEQSSTVNAVGNTVSYNGSNGAELRTNSQGTFTANTINGNGTRPATEAGSRNGIHVRYSHASIADGNNIAYNAVGGVASYASVVEVLNSAITGNVVNGLSATLGSSLSVTGSTISGNGATGVLVQLNSSIIIQGGAMIQGNNGNGIELVRASTLQLSGQTTQATGNVGFGLECQDPESSVANFNLLNGTVSPACTGF